MSSDSAVYVVFLYKMSVTKGRMNYSGEGAVNFRGAEATWNRFCQVVIPHEDSCQSGKLVYYFWSISCLWLCASCFVSLSQQRIFEIGSKTAGGSASSDSHSPTNELCFSDKHANGHFSKTNVDILAICSFTFLLR